ncbi:bile acid:sodium symporter family protein [Marinobacterium jannaschii]|uniref:bile acid:sodium symporter family protein n=1 Tax=Marinobacterium jannaschii TaxID=64970 RepID=UPI000484C83D|nr:bile acid:sodium symporter family protein [Marinobacterium jannaschii]
MSGALIPQLVLPAALFTIMLGLGLTLSMAQFIEVFRRPRGLLLGLFLQIALLPLLGWLVIGLFGLTAPIALGLIILTLSPGGATSNIITLLARGDTALSVSLTAVSSLLTPFTLPLLAAFFLSQLMPDMPAAQFPVITVMAKLLVMSVLPVLLGMWFASRFPASAAVLRHWVGRAALLFMAVAVGLIVTVNLERLPGLLIESGPAVVCLILLAAGVSLMLSRQFGLDDRQCWTLVVEVGIQNAATAIFVTAVVLQRADMAATALVYGILMNLPALLLILYRRRLGQKEIA